MGIFSGYIFASDYDGTLADSKGQIPEEVRRAIKHFTANGGLFTVCTGRTKQGFHAFDPKLMNAPVLLANGAMAYDFVTGETAFLDGIYHDSIGTVNRIIDGYPDLGVEIYGADFSSCVINPHERNVSHLNHQSIAFSVVDSVPQEIFPAVKIMVSVGRDRCMDFQRFLDSTDMGTLKYIPQYGDFIEIISAATDKGKGLLKLAGSCGIERSHVFAIGDGSNDITMLKAAQVGFVPDNADDEVKSAGDITVKSNDEFAVADAIEKIEQIIKSNN